MSAAQAVLGEVADERQAQLDKWGPQHYLPNGTDRPGDTMVAEANKAETDRLASRGRLTWRQVLEEEVREAYAETDPARLRAELVQVAAVATAWVEAIDHKQQTP